MPDSSLTEHRRPLPITWIREHWPPIAASAVLLAVVTACVIASVRRSDGRFVYVLDDPYIHMAVAKNLTQHGVFGVTRYGFSSSASSIVWPLLLSTVYVVTGAEVFAPLVLNILFAAGALWVAHAMLRSRRVPSWLSFCCLLSVVFCTPLPAIILTGLEHSLHVLLAVAFVYLAANRLGEGTTPQQGSCGMQRVCYLGLPALLTMARYEGAFMVGVVCILWMVRREIREAIVLGVAAVAPIVLNGLVAMYYGWHFLPNPVLLKGRMPPGSSFDQIVHSLRSTAATMIGQPHIPAMLFVTAVLLVAAYRRGGWARTAGTHMLWIVLATTLLHVQFAKTDWFFRYEAYLMACGMVACFLVGYEACLRGMTWSVTGRRLALCGIIALATVPILRRAATSLTGIPSTSALIYRQHIQMASFLERYYPGESVAANDIGAINFFADINTLDLWGLGSLEVADARLAGRYGPQEIHRLSRDHGARIAVVYTDWFEQDFGGLPPQWVEVGQWSIPNPLKRGPIVVSFYAVDPEEAAPLAENLRQFRRQLPKAVAQLGPDRDAQDRIRTRSGGLGSRKTTHESRQGLQWSSARRVGGEPAHPVGRVVW